MKKIKFLIASMLGAIALVFACIFGLGVNAKDTTITADFTDITAPLTSASEGNAKDLYDAGWRTSSSFNGTYSTGGHSYPKIKSSKSNYIQTPNFVDDKGATETKSVDVTISVATDDSSNAYNFILKAYDSDNAEVATATGETGTSKAFKSNTLKLTSTTNDIKYIRFDGCVSGTTSKMVLFQHSMFLTQLLKLIQLMKMLQKL